MDSIITAAAQALAAGDPLGALKRVALRNDPPALALRGIAMAQLGDLARAKSLLRRAARSFGAREPLARARCIVAQAEVALAARELGWSGASLESARKALIAHGDHANAAHARYLEIRRLVLMGRIDEADDMLARVDSSALPPALRVVHQLAVAGIATRRLRIRLAQEAVNEAQRCARHAGIAALAAEVDSAARVLTAPAARLIAGGANRVLLLRDVETLLTSGALIVDACRLAVCDTNAAVPLARRPVLFTLARALGEAWPGDVSREALIARAFRGKRADESHRVRLRVEVGRLRRELGSLAGVSATPGGFALAPRRAKAVVVLAPPEEDENAAVVACLADGEEWSSSALALALGTGQRTIQRALDALLTAGKVQGIGRGRARRWVLPAAPGFTTALLLPGVLA
ncbi:MAG: helix-turn-helix domain-containing protein [Proteobacteria bacterium]|nr:helix-turn-helix domain-containing protein [Pseudomonadota bacterium]